ncbi:MAG: methylated-DNA--[protein]-cysteine S-methyltransferase, partial [Rhodospirillaceae bacterium]|nr:methylated-DNA--[protein]-cysteine S-methyltransferase [Rhodospirillaceae bacterium]
YGETRTYGEIARWLRSAPRAVGGACGRNPIPIIIPCHRVVASDGLGGYSGDGGTDTKTWLLELEGWSAHGPRTLFDAPPDAEMGDAEPSLGLQ